MSAQPAIPPSYGARQAQPLAAMQGDGAAGWDFFEPPDPKDRRGTWQELVLERGQDAARAAAALFATPDGQVLLEFLADASVRRPCFVLGMPDPGTYAAFREGQNGLFYAILDLIARGRGEDATGLRQPGA